MKKTLRLTVIITVVSLLISACAAGPKGQNGSAAVDTVTAKTMRLIRAEGSIELTDESQSFPWPEGIVCIREVTEDRRYTNSALARRIPEEELQKEE